MSHPWCSVFLPGGKQLLTGGDDGHVHFWDVRTGRQSLDLPTGKDPGAGVAVEFSPDGSRLAAPHGKLVRIWDTRTGEALRDLKGHTDRVVSVATGVPNCEASATVAK